MFDNMTMAALESRAVDVQKLASNFIDIIADCEGLEDFSLRNELQNRYPLATWLSESRFSQTLRSRSRNTLFVRPGTEGGWVMEVPGSVYTLEPVNSGDDCCWTIPDFAKCSGEVPLSMVCLKDCNNIFDDMVYERLRIDRRVSLEGFAREGETLDSVENRIRHLWMAFYTFHTVILGTMNTSDNIVKPFHGLLEVLQNDAVVSISGANILAAFDSIACRLDVLGGNGWAFALNPLLYRSLEEVVRPDERGNLPTGWAKDGNGRLTFHGIGFIDDKLVPVDLEEGKGDIWLIDGEATGMFLGYAVGNEKEISKDFTEKEKAEGCGEICYYLYNYGTVANNNANRLMVISGVAVSSSCTEIGDLAGLINPTTLVPAV